MRQEERESLGFVILELVVDLRILHPVMGLKKVYWELVKASSQKGLELGLGRDKFIDLCTKAGLDVPRRRSGHRTTYSTKSNRYTNLLAGRELNDINQVWVSDITYFWVGNRFYYLTFIMDIYSRYIVGYHVSPFLRADANVSALKMALNVRGNPQFENLIHHSDKGTQYVFNEYIQLLEKHHIQISMANIVYDNVHCERLNGTIKNEYLIHAHIENEKQLIEATKKAVLLYNNHRPHLALDYQTPAELELNIKQISIEKRKKMSIYVDETFLKKQKISANQLVLF